MGLRGAASVIKLESNAPQDDAEFLAKAFPSASFVREDFEIYNGKNVTTLVAGNELTIFLVPSERMPSNDSGVVIVDSEQDIAEAKKASALNMLQIQNGNSQQLQIGELKLPSGACILLGTFDSVNSKSGRQLLARRLSGLPVANNNSSQANGSPTRTSPSAKGSPSKLPTFETLQVQQLGMNGKLQPNFPLNSRTAVPIETDLFKGKMLFLMRPANPAEEDPYWNDRIFSQKKRRIIVQVQGKFKYQPEGTVYAGAEVSKPMKLGLVTRGLCGVLLRLVEASNSNVHYSFGEAKEKAHIVVPAHTFFERVIATPPGETPPCIEEPFEESKESIAKRKKSKGVGEWNTSDTYSFAFFSMYIDLPTWSLVGLPVSGDISLKTFWGDSLLSICMYEKRGSTQKHLQGDNQYAFSVQVEYLGKRPKIESPEASLSPEDEDDEDDLIHWDERKTSSSVDLLIGNYTSVPIRRSESQVFIVDPGSLLDQASGDLYYDAQEDDITIGSGDTQQQMATATPCTAISLTDLLASIDTSCPCWVEVYSKNRPGGYLRACAINSGTRTSLRAFVDCQQLVEGSDLSKMVDLAFSPRMSFAERLRRMVGYALAHPDQCNLRANKLKSFVEKDAAVLDDAFLKRPPPSGVTRAERHKIELSGYVGRAISDRHWAEEWMAVTDKTVCFYHPEKRNPNFRVHIANICKIRKLPAEQCPNLGQFHFLAIETVGRCIYLMFAEENERDTMLIKLPKLMVLTGEVHRASEMSTGTNMSLAFLSNPSEEYLQKSSMWNCKNRRILNCGVFVFREQGGSNANELVEDALRKRLQPELEHSDDHHALRSAFLHSAAALKSANVHNLSDEARMAFFINLYHLMILHAFLVLGPPDSSLKWISYFNNVAYEVSDDIFSIAELEHCILRTRMSHPSQFMSRFVIPKSSYRMALRNGDFRLNFALNCGSRSCPSKIYIYQVGKLEQQLHDASRLYLDSVRITVKQQKNNNSPDLVVFVPRICQWYAPDFGSNEELLSKIEPFLQDGVRQALAKAKSPPSTRYNMDSIAIRYQQFNFDCRMLTL